MTDRSTTPDQGSARQLAIHVAAILAAQDADLGPIVQRVLSSIECAIEESGKAIAKIEQRIKRAITRHHGESSRCCDRCYSLIYGRVTDELLGNQHLLDQVVARTRLAPVGTPLDQVLLLLQSSPKETQVQYCGELVLSVREAVPHLRDLIEVLREIRDRLPPLPAGLPDEPPARHEPVAYPEFAAPAPDLYTE